MTQIELGNLRVSKLGMFYQIIRMLYLSFLFISTLTGEVANTKMV